ncbi:hypothetical protein KOAAANKH_02549 [Brevundimonas sp. NIBR10]|uniref:hypothetical protein n=1 Tax=Brevundimonas sp. NIBR10 TaxID=3015997 RepID=UPI0022F192D3|nr:hypothetical protein [Brevundimonas sp. NIBR10]WGM47667.1 hypothetical protein KOAAANKH_02549 [Brevundimonas sp. NIBR10]
MTTKQAALKLYRDAMAGQGQEGARKRWRLACHALAMHATGSSLTAYAKACETHKRADWRDAAKAMAATLGEAVPVRVIAEPKAATLLEYLSKRGGIDDTGGDLQAMDAHLWHKARPFRRQLIQPGGMSLCEAADVAHDAGYFDDLPFPEWDSADNQHAVTSAQLLERIRRELAGKPCYPWATGNAERASEADMVARYGSDFPGDWREAA